jgi:hypothetical protein
MSAAIVTLAPKNLQTPESVFWKSNGDALKTAIGKSTESRAKICAASAISTATIKKAIDGNRITNATANRIIKGLNACGINVTKEQLFVYSE